MTTTIHDVLAELRERATSEREKSDLFEDLIAKFLRTDAWVPVVHESGNNGCGQPHKLLRLLSHGDDSSIRPRSVAQTGRLRAVNFWTEQRSKFGFGMINTTTVSGEPSGPRHTVVKVKELRT